MPVITVDYLETLLKTEFNEDDAEQIEEIILNVQSELEEHLDQPLEITEITGEEHFLDYQSQQIFLNKTPVLEIGTVTVNGTEITTPIWQKRRWGLDLGTTLTLAMVDPVIWVPSAYAFSSVPPDVYALATGSVPESVFVIDYTAGLDGPNIRVIKSLVTRAVRREMAGINAGDFDAGDYSSMSVEDYSMQRNTAVMAGRIGSFTEKELLLIRRLRRKRVWG